MIGPMVMFRSLPQGEGMKIVKPHILYVSVIVAIITFVFWIATFLVISVRDDRQSSASDERSVPIPRTY